MTRGKKTIGKPHKPDSGKTRRSIAGSNLAETRGKALRKEAGEVSHASRVLIEHTSATLRKALKRLADR